MPAVLLLSHLSARDVELHLPGGTGTPEHRQTLFSVQAEKRKKEGKTFHSLLTKSQTFPKKVNSFHEKFQLIANHVSSKTSVSTVLCLFYSKPFKEGDL